RGDHHRAHSLTSAGIRYPDDRDIGDCGVGVEHSFDLEGGDVLGVADDRVLDPARDHHVAVRVDPALVTATEPTVRVESVGIEGRVRVPEEALRTLQPQLTLFTWRHFALVVAHYTNLDPGHGRPDRVVENRGVGVQ